MIIKKISVDKLKPNPKNPRHINKVKYNKLIKSIKEFPKMLRIRPIVVDENYIVLGGNMRLKALKELNIKETYYLQESDLKENEKKEFIIKDNVGYGDWEWLTLTDNWDINKLDEWGVKVPTIKNTELLSNLKYEPIYYEPKIEPNINLEDCINLNKYNSKIDALNEYKLTKKQKEILKIFAYRFIKIDFESVANYYYFNANNEEKKALERLRMVLTDNGINGFSDDDLIKILGFTDVDFNKR